MIEVDIDASKVDSLLNRLKGDDYRKAIRTALRKSSMKLKKQTDENFRHLVVKNRGGSGSLTDSTRRDSAGKRLGPPSSVKLYLNGTTPRAVVHIRKKADYRALFFELGTRERYRRAKTRRSARRNRVHSKPAYTGRILEGRYFERAKKAKEAEIFGDMKNEVINAIKRIIR